MCVINAKSKHFATLNHFTCLTLVSLVPKILREKSVNVTGTRRSGEGPGARLWCICFFLDMEIRQTQLYWNILYLLYTTILKYTISVVYNRYSIFQYSCVGRISITLFNTNTTEMQGRIKLFGAPRQWKNFRPLFQAVFLSWGGGGITPKAESNNTPPSPKTEITNILFYILSFSSIIKLKITFL
jgi:hypothetical protein